MSFFLKEFRTIKNHIQKTDNSHLTHSRNSSMDSSSISTSEFFHFQLDKSPFDNDLNTIYSEDILDTEVIQLFDFKRKNIIYFIYSRWMGIVFVVMIATLVMKKLTIIIYKQRTMTDHLYLLIRH